MSNTSFIIVETKNGSATPSKVWEASGEQDYMARVAATNPRSGDDFTDFQAVIAGEQDRHAMRVQTLRFSDFADIDPDEADVRILQAAYRLGWIHQFKVTADPKSGEWIGDPEFVGAAIWSGWVSRVDTDAVHFDTFEREVGREQITCAIAVEWAADGQ
jgi:hypothetical protein